ncbi:MAG: HD domain-containing phosphohydrolase [Hyphomicrobiales bacterium]
MTQAYHFPQTVVIITDDLANATKVARKMAGIVSIELFNWKSFKADDVNKYDIPVFDIDIQVSKNVAWLKTIQSKNEKLKETVFSFDSGNRSLVVQANALGANISVARPLNSDQLTNVIVKLCNENIATKTIKHDDSSQIKKSSEACLTVSDLMDSIAISIRKGGKLPVQEMQESSRQIIDAIQNVDMDNWMKAVRSHSSYTYRHAMIVAGFAAAFSNKYNLAPAEKERLTLGALVHDIGKVKVPQKILDKPGKLDPEELVKMQRHPADGAAILVKDSRMSKELIAIARSHHEYLDGSGYPDGLKADEIPDIVRLITVIDIYSALLEARSYKLSMEPREAYDTLVAMGDKLDQDIVRAFEPIAMDEEAHVFIKLIAGSAA